MSFYEQDYMPYVVGIGGANIDIQGISNQKIKLCDSNPGVIEYSSGGVGRNICENLSRVGIYTKYITCLGNDMFGKKIMSDCVDARMDMENSFIMEKADTSSYLSLIDSDGDMKAALSHMDILNLLTVEKLALKHDIIDRARIILIETNLREDVIDYITDRYKDKIIFADTVSTKKAEKLRRYLRYIDTLKPNIYEAQIFSGTEIKNQDSLETAARIIIQKGVKNLFISMGADGVYYMDSSLNGKHYKSPRVNVINSTGAGDSMMAGLLYGKFRKMDVDKTIKFSLALAAYTIEDKNTINKGISEQKVLDRMKGI